MNRTKSAVSLEVCAGSYSDCLAAQKGGADRVELNSALALGGLTPTSAVLDRVIADTDLEVIAMVRPRAGGFHYSPEEQTVMMAEAEMLLKHGADGLAFGYLNADGTVDVDATRAMVDLIHRHGKTAVFHRAIDVTPDLQEAAATLADLGVDRILTSGQQAKAADGLEAIRALQDAFQERMEILPGSGVNALNAKDILDRTGVHQLHSSCKGYRTDPTTRRGAVSYGYLPDPHEMEIDAVDPLLVQTLAAVCHQTQDKDSEAQAA